MSVSDRLLPHAGTLIITPTEQYEGVGSTFGSGVQEASIIVEADHIRIYYTAIEDINKNRICLVTTTDLVNFTKLGPVIGRGLGGAPSNRNAQGSCVIKSNGVYYCFATDGYSSDAGTRNVYLYKSTTTGLPGTFSYVGLIFTSDIYYSGTHFNGYGNTWVHPEPINGVYYGMVEAQNDAPYWEGIWITATNIEGPWAMHHLLKSQLQIAANCMFGGFYLFRSGGIWHAYYHYTPYYDAPNPNHGNLPTFIAWATSPDGTTWTKKEVPFLGINAHPFPITDQVADPAWAYVPWLDKCVFVWEYCDNESSVFQAQIRMQTYDGTYEELIAPEAVPYLINKNTLLIAKRKIPLSTIGTRGNLSRMHKINSDSIDTFIPGGAANDLIETEVNGKYLIVPLKPLQLSTSDFNIAQ